MKRTLIAVILLFQLFSYSQGISVDSQTYTPQQLIEDILIDSDCIENVVVTNVYGGDFNGSDQSYGYFDASGTSFPFQSGLVLSTGRLQNVPGPNNSLSDDDAPNWQGDVDLETALNENNTINATILEFDFTSIASQISFRYIFASEEYQEGNANSCQYSDLFGFLIRPVSGGGQYQNIALVPNTYTPVKVTTVTPGVPGACPPQNETYFGNYNYGNTPINFNGQTTVLTATANVTPNATYHVKLVIADEQNYRYDSAVFLEAASFELSTDLGPDRLLINNNALCEGETLELSASQPGQNTYEWYRNGNLVQGVSTGCGSCDTFTVTEPGNYSVEVNYANGCISYGDVIIEYADLPVANDNVLIECDSNEDGLTTFNLYDAISNLTSNDNTLSVSDFFLTENEALDNSNPIINPNEFQNDYPMQIVFARVVNSNNCFDIASLELQTSNNTLNIPQLDACDSDDFDGFATFNLNEIETSIIAQIPTSANVTYYETEEDALNEVNVLPISFENTSTYSQTIYVKVESNSQCYSITTANLNVLDPPILESDATTIYCTNNYPETITLYGGVANDIPNNYYYEWLLNGNPTGIDTSFTEINETGTYTVIVTNTDGCSSSRTINVNASSTAIIDDVSYSGMYPNNFVEIITSGEGIYQYALDDSEGSYQDSNIFYGVTEGFHTVYIKDLNGCGIIEQTISVLGFPKFFTPNGDNYHETWRVIGNDEQLSEIQTIEIYNRYGKLITVLPSSNLVWDGSYHGKKLPSDDYWFSVKFHNGKTIVNHFALKR